MAWETTPKTRSCPCNGTLLKQRRLLRGWTQEELAERSGFSVRLIAKAERGGAIHADTIEHLAEALSTPQIPLYPEDLAANPKELTRQFLDNLQRFKQNAVQKSRAFLADNIVFTMSGNPEVLPFAGVYEGIEAMDKATRCFFDFLDYHSHTIEALVADGNDVVSCIRVCASVKGFSQLAEPVATALVVGRFKFERGKMIAHSSDFQTNSAEHTARAQKAMLAEHQCSAGESS